MLIKREKKLTTKSLGVKRLCEAFLIATAVSFTAVPVQAKDSSTIERVVTVKFKASDLDANDGLTKVYAKLQRRAKNFCRSDKATLKFHGQTLDECTQELLEQFVESTNLESLQTYHSAMMQSETAAG